MTYVPTKTARYAPLPEMLRVTSKLVAAKTQIILFVVQTVRVAVLQDRAAVCRIMGLMAAVPSQMPVAAMTKRRVVPLGSGVTQTQLYSTTALLHSLKIMNYNTITVY